VEYKTLIKLVLAPTTKFLQMLSFKEVDLLSGIKFLEFYLKPNDYSKKDWVDDLKSRKGTLFGSISGSHVEAGWCWSNQCWKQFQCIGCP
jgi:hypothetical protein